MAEKGDVIGSWDASSCIWGEVAEKCTSTLPCSSLWLDNILAKEPSATANAFKSSNQAEILEQGVDLSDVDTEQETSSRHEESYH